MRALVLVLLLTWFSACTVSLDDHAGRACDASHPCLDGRVCVEGLCVPVGTCPDTPVGEPCEVGKGVCASTGVWTCANGTPACNAVAREPEPAEVCDGLDNDCDGVTDDVSGCMVTLAGNGPAGFADGTGNAARVAMPGYLTADGEGNLYLADTGNHAIRRITPAGEVTTVAGTGRCGFRDGPAATARFCEPIAVVRAPDGALFVSDGRNHRIRRIHEGQVTTIAGIGVAGFGDGPALTARLHFPMGLFLRSNGELLIADALNARIRLYTPGEHPQLSTFASAGWGTTEGSRSTVRFQGVADVVEDSQGVLYVSDESASRLRRLPLEGESTTIAGSLYDWDYRDGLGAGALMGNPTQLLLDEAAGVLYFLDSWSHRVRALPLSGTEPTYPVAGGSGWGYVDGPLEQARTLFLRGFTKVGQDFFFSDSNHAIRRTSDVGGVPTTGEFVGGSLGQLTLDGPAASARLRHPRGLVLAPDGGFYWVDYADHLVRTLTPEGRVVTLVGTPGAPAEGNTLGAFANARVSWPSGLGFGPDGMLYLADGGNCALRKLDLATQQLTHFAGAADGSCDHADGSLSESLFDEPRAISFGKDVSGQDVMYVADAVNHVLRKIILPDGPVSTIAGTPHAWGTADGPPGTGRFTDMGPMASDQAGNVWVIDNGMVRHVSPAGVLSTAYADLPTYAEAVALDGEALVVSGANMILRMNALPPSKSSLQVVFEGPLGWQDGVNLEAGGGYMESLVVTPEAYYFADTSNGRLRRLWR